MKEIETRLQALCLFLLIGVMLPVAVWGADVHQLTVKTSPMMAGTLNTSSAALEAGDSIHLYAYANNNFTFVQWKDESGAVVSKLMDFYYTMPNHDSQLTAEYEYNPANPANPVRNYWNKELGEVIVDDFVTGSLQSAVKTAIGDSKASDVQMITVAGVMNTNDFGIINTYSSCVLLDLSRVTGITQVPSYAFDYTNMESVYLPATIEKMGYRAFYECKQLSSLIVYAMTPPTLENGVFAGVPDGLVVYVPASAIAKYQEAEVWKDFIILPIQEDIRSISISLPDGVNVQDYAHMWLELTNTKSGQRMHYVMTDRQQYTFANIIRNTSWNVTLRNERGDVFGQIDNVEVKDENVTVTFASLSNPQNVSLSVFTPDGNDVTNQLQVTWTDAQGNYMAQGASLSGLPVGYQVNYRVVLSQELAMTYNTPTEVAYTLKDGGNNITLQLSPITQITLSGKVKDATTGLPLGGAIVSASQTFGGKYSKTLNAKTDSKGEYTLTIAAVPTSLAFAAANYISQTMDFSNYEFDGLNEFPVPDVSLKSITGATISVGFTYTTVEGETQNWYSDYQNVSYTLYNSTREKPITQFNVQYPQIVLLEEVEDGDVLRLTATSRTNAFNAVEATATIAEQKAETTFAITELGRIEASFSKTGNATVVGSLYDASGKLVKTYNYSEAKLTINDLADGNYTLVSMGSSRLFNTIYDLAQLPQTGLAEGSDYVLNTVEVKSGQVSAISISEVPTLDESKLYYTGDNTSFTVNKPSIVAGNYLTLTGRIDFKPAYATSVSNVQMIVDLPESCEFVENSVMVGNSTSSYTLNGNRITIPMTRYTDRVRFCIIPTLGGEYAPSAFVQFDIDGETVTQPIGSANYTAKDLSISVPSTVAKITIPISGTAIGRSDIEIYDNDVLIGQTTSLANGTWATTCELNEPYNLSTHNIFAKVTTQTGLGLVSENMSCMYDKNAIEVNTVTMINTAHTAANLDLHDYVTVFDFQNPKESYPAYWYWPSYPDFTFLVDFTNNDTTIVKDVVLYVFTDDDKVVTLYPEYNEKKDKFVATAKFDSYSLPYNVSVDYSVDDFIAKIDYKEITEVYNNSLNLRTSFDAIQDTRNRFSEQLLALQEDKTADYSLIEKLFETYCMELGLESDNDAVLLLVDSLRQMSSAERGLLRDSVLKAESLFSDAEVIRYFEEQEDLLKDYVYNFSVNDLPFNITRHTCNGLQPSTLIADGFLTLATLDGDTIYVKGDVAFLEFADFKANTYYKLELTETFAKTSRRVSISGMWEAAIQKLDECNSKLVQAQTIALDAITEIAEYFGAKIADLNNTANMYRAMAKVDREMGLIEGAGELLDNARDLEQKALELEKQAAKYKQLTADATVAGKAIVGKAVQLLGSLATLAIDVKNWWNLHKKIESKIPCKNNEAYAEQLNSDVTYYGSLICLGDVVTFAGEAFAVYSAAMGLAGTPLTGGLSTVIGGAGGLIGAGVSIIAGLTFSWVSSHYYKKLKKEVDNLKCGDGPEPKDPPTPPTPPGGGAPNVKDPSGYVYEGVASNRVEGVTATAYYKEMVEDMYGDLHENIVKWDAAEYAQENPLFTDEFGMYAWDVPNGLWQVKFEKEGYETTYSEWLPVPPPQLDVNIAMKQNRQPEVKTARAYEDAVEVEFDKYMMPELLTTENIMVMQNGTAVEGTVELLNEEVSYEGETETFASKIRFNAAQPFTEQEITLMVNNRVRSYAGIRMQDDYQQKFTIEQEIKQIVCDSLMAVGYGEKTMLTISALPASASKGKSLSVKTSSPIILGVETDQVVIGNDGKATITVSGELPGIAAMTFSVEGTDKAAVTIVSVEQRVYQTVAAPTANIASGTEIEKGTQIVLSCETEGATIYYTLDGTCPCDEQKRIKYTGPITLPLGHITLKAVAVRDGMDDSDIVTYEYFVQDKDGVQTIKESGDVEVYYQDGAIVVSGAKGGDCHIYDLQGRELASRSKLSNHTRINVPGNNVYIVSVSYGNDQKVVCKVMKQ